MKHELISDDIAGAGQSRISAIISDYPWDALGNATIVDVGGGVGTYLNVVTIATYYRPVITGALTLPLLSRFGDLSVILQDRPTVRPQALQYWEQNLPAAIETGRMTF